MTQLSKSILIFEFFFICLSVEALSQETVDVTFRYLPPIPTSTVYVPGEFNAWQRDATSQMTSVGNNTFVRTVTLQIGRVGGVIPGAYQYKFYYPEIGDGVWPNDPLNHRSNPSDHDNSILYIKDPTIYQFIPNQRTGIVTTSTPTISAYLFPKNPTALDTATIALKVDATVYRNIGKSYDVTLKQFSYKLPTPLENGTHNVYLSAGANNDSVTIIVRAGAVQITNIGNFVTRNRVRTLYGLVEDTRIDTVKIMRNNIDTLFARTTGGRYSLDVNLVEGLNTFRAFIKDSSSATQISSPVTYTYLVNHVPRASISYANLGQTIRIDASGSTDPDPGQTQTLQFSWNADSTNPQALAGMPATGDHVDFPKPTKPGEYFVRLIVTDNDSNKDTARSFFTILQDTTFQLSTIATVPAWAKQGRLYSMFFKGMTQAGTINAALSYLPYIKNMGFNILWVLPVMWNAYPIDNGPGPGYNIKDFYTVAPEYGTNDDFGNFVRQAHSLGMKVILDVTPNHTSYQHPFVLESRQYRENSPRWNFYVHSNTSHNSNGLGVSMTNDGFQYYDGWDQILNYNWSDIDARTYMIDVYKWWIQQFDLDGYRLDVYWGPHNRANNYTSGENEMGIPVRQALKRIKPDIYLLGETDGGGSDNFADNGGGIDGAYDWRLYGSIAGLYPNGFQNFVNNIYNGGSFPGQNSSFLRFLENHDEERIVYRYQSYLMTKPPGTVIFTAPGMPMIWQGQELGIGLLVPPGEDRRRTVVDWNFRAAPYLQAHYQRLAQIRAQFPAFSTQQFKILSSTFPVFAYLRSYAGEDGIVAANFSDNGNPVQVSLQINGTDLAIPAQNNPYKLSDLYNDSSTTVTFLNGQLTLNLTLPSLGSAVFVLSDSVKRLILPSLTGVASGGKLAEVPNEFRLEQNYPNPFNPKTTFAFSVPSRSSLTLKIYNLLGEEVVTVAEGEYGAGTYQVMWSGGTSRGMAASSGIYFARLQAGAFVQIRKIVLLK